MTEAHVQAYWEVAKANGFTRLERFALPLLHREAFIDRKIRALQASIRKNPTVLRYSDDPAAVRFFNVVDPRGEDSTGTP